MKYRYTKYTGDLLDEIDLEDLVSKLSELLLTSGFNNPWGNPLDSDEDRTMNFTSPAGSGSVASALRSIRSFQPLACAARLAAAAIRVMATATAR